VPERRCRNCLIAYTHSAFFFQVDYFAFAFYRQQARPFRLDQRRFSISEAMRFPFTQAVLCLLTRRTNLRINLSPDSTVWAGPRRTEQIVS
jgi:hypothetical protein